MQLRFHLLNLAHLETNKKNSSCAYTQKIVKLAKMLKNFGHVVFTVSKVPMLSATNL